MSNLVIEIPEDLSRRVTELAAVERKTAEQVVIETLRSSPSAPGSPAAILRMINSPPHLTVEDIEALESAITSGRLPASKPNPFPIGPDLDLAARNECG
jgi:hypothetical protein